MSPVGRWSAIGAATLGLVSVATWNLGDASSADEIRLDGAQLFHAKGCATCHVGPDASPSQGTAFPRLDDAREWAGERRPGLTAADYLTESLAAPNAFISPDFQPAQAGPAGAMPQLRLTSEEIDALVTYLLDR